MTFSFKHSLRAAAAACLVTVSTTALYAQDAWPTGPVEVVMHTKPGGTSDIFIRTGTRNRPDDCCPELSRRWRCRANGQSPVRQA